MKIKFFKTIFGYRIRFRLKLKFECYNAKKRVQEMSDCLDALAGELTSK